MGLDHRMQPQIEESGENYVQAMANPTKIKVIKNKKHFPGVVRNGE